MWPVLCYEKLHSDNSYNGEVESVPLVPWSAYLCDRGWGAINASRHLDHWVAHLQCPGVHDSLDGQVLSKCEILVGGSCQEVPQIVLLCAGICSVQRWKDKQCIDRDVKQSTFQFIFA